MLLDELDREELLDRDELLEYGVGGVGGCRRLRGCWGRRGGWRGRRRRWCGQRERVAAHKSPLHLTIAPASQLSSNAALQGSRLAVSGDRDDGPVGAAVPLKLSGDRYRLPGDERRRPAGKARPQHNRSGETIRNLGKQIGGCPRLAPAERLGAMRMSRPPDRPEARQRGSGELPSRLPPPCAERKA